jgi:CBS domain-containing protein
MSAPAVVVPPTQEASAALDRMNELKFRRLPVERDGRIVGIVTRGDLEAKLGWDRMAWRRLGRLVQDAMTPDPVTIGPEDRLEKAAGLMLQHRIGGLPVVEDGKVVGIITESDLFRAFVKMIAQQAA